MPSLEPKPLVVAPKGPTGAFMVELLIYNGSPFNDHWAYWVRSQANRDIGVMIDAIGNVREGFSIRRSHSFEPPTKKIPLQWVDGKHFDEKAMLNHGKQKIDNALVCGFETSVYKVKAPGKSLNAVNDGVSFNLTAFCEPACGYSRIPSCTHPRIVYCYQIIPANMDILGHTRQEDRAKGLPDMDCRVCRPTC